jgi:hypothetical protein
MPWDGMKRRAEDRGEESPETVLARIDERVKNISEKLTVHMVSFEVHKVDDDKNFSRITWLLGIGAGIMGTVQFIGFMIHK